MKFKELFLWVSLLGILLAGYLLFGQNRSEAPVEPQTGNLNLIQNNSLIPISPIYIPHTFVHGTLIGCLEWYESRGDEGAYNHCDTDGREKFGCMQFGDIEFQDFCVERYGLKDNIWDCNVAKVCADKMIDDGYMSKWGTLKYCL